jgi:hypothetical protein
MALKQTLHGFKDLILPSPFKTKRKQIKQMIESVERDVWGLQEWAGRGIILKKSQD